MLKNTNERYGAIAKLLHWAIALLILGLSGLGLYMVDLTYYDRWYNASLTAHKALGILALELGVFKILWALCSRTPALPEGMRPWERHAARAMHGVLFAMMLLIPLSGYAISTSDGAAVSFFGLYEIPAVIPPLEGMNELASEIHYYLAYLTLGLVAMHAGAALKHQLVNRDGTLSRML